MYTARATEHHLAVTLALATFAQPTSANQSE
jgi:hypothetical protein